MKNPYHRIFVLFILALLPFGAFAEVKSTEDDFFGEDDVAVTVVESTGKDPTKLFSESAEGLRWGGTVSSSATWNGGWVGDWPKLTDPSDKWKDGLDYGLSTKLFLDGRPNEDFRFRLSLKTGYPFTSDTKNVVTDPTPSAGGTDARSSTLKVPNIDVWEMFTDVTVNNALFLRFGKQSASWGVSYFYSPGDVISLTAKDASDPLAEREGPVATKITIPFPNQKANLTGYVIARDSYFKGELPTVQSLGYALQGDVLVGDAQLTLGGFYQRDNAPKAVATINTGFGFLNLPVMSDINMFSEAVFSYGSDVRKGSGTAATSGFNPMQIGTVKYASVSDWEKTVYYTGTIGASYSNSNANLTLRAEYLYNPFGSNDKDAASKGYNSVMDGALGFGEVMTPAMHNMTGLLSLAKLFGNDKLGFSTLWQQNLSDGSGWVKPSFSLKPWDVLSFNWGLSVVYGDAGTQFPLQFQARDKNGLATGTKRVTLNVGVTFGTGKY